MSHTAARPGWHPALVGVRLLLLDFDGPVVRLLPDPEHVQLARQLAGWCAERMDLPLEGPAIDHVTVLREAHRRAPHLAAEAERLATAAELAAAASRTAYPDAIATMRHWLADGGRLAIVSNNAEQAVRRVLATAGFSVGPDGGEPAYGCTIHARQPGGIARLKPRPDLLLDALRSHGVPADQAVMIGDTSGDVRAGAAAGVRTIGVADSVDRAEELRACGAAAVVGRLAELQESSGPGAAGV